MKKIILSTFITTIAITACMNFNNNFTVEENTIQFKNISAMALGYDRSMSEKTIKATVIDSYFRQVCKNGKIIRWNKSTFPLKVYIEDSKSLPDYYREIVMNAYTSWQRASEGLVRFEFVESPSEADMKCYFKNTDNKIEIKPIGLNK